MNYKFTNKDWFDYISKLSNRKVNERNSSGITVWAILTFLVLIISKVMGLLEDMPLNKLSVITFSKYLSFLINSVIFIYLVINFIFVSTNGQDQSRLLSHISMKKITIFIHSLYLILFIGILSNVFLAFNSKQVYVSKLIYISIIFEYMAIWLSLVFLKKDMRIELVTKGKNLLGVGYRVSNKIHGQIISLIFISVFVGYYIDIFIPVKTIKSITIDFNILYLVFYFIGFFIALIILAFNYSGFISSNWLADLEKAIIVNELTVDEIKENFLKGYYGEPLSNLIRQIENDVEDISSVMKETLKNYIADNEDGLLTNIEDYNAPDNLNELRDRCQSLESKLKTLDNYISKLERMQLIIINNKTLIRGLLRNPNITYEERSYLISISESVEENIERFAELLNLVKQKSTKLQIELISIEGALEDKIISLEEELENKIADLEKINSYYCDKGNDDKSLNEDN